MVIYNDAQIFFTSYLGILIQVAVFIGALIPGLKFLNKKLDERINDNIDKKIDPIVEGVCKQLNEVKTAMETHMAATNEAIKHINRATEFLQDLISKK